MPCIKPTFRSQNGPFAVTKICQPPPVLSGTYRLPWSKLLTDENAPPTSVFMLPSFIVNKLSAPCAPLSLTPALPYQPSGPLRKNRPRLRRPPWRTSSVAHLPTWVALQSTSRPPPCCLPFSPTCPPSRAHSSSHPDLGGLPRKTSESFTLEDPRAGRNQPLHAQSKPGMGTAHHSPCL